MEKSSRGAGGLLGAHQEKRHGRKNKKGFLKKGFIHGVVLGKKEGTRAGM